MRRGSGGVLLVGVLIVAVSAPCLAGAMYRNDSGAVARAVRIEFSEPVEITSMWPTFPWHDPQGPATAIVLSGGEVPAGGWLYFSWRPDSARVVDIVWSQSSVDRVCELSLDSLTRGDVPALREGFVTGHTLMDYYSTMTFRNLLESTLDSIRVTGGGWVVFDNYWSYHSLQPPIIGHFVDRGYYDFRDATEEELKVMVEQTHARGMKFALMIELNWDVLRGTWQGWEYQQTFWERSQRFLWDMCAQLSGAGDYAGATRYWDQWFTAYARCALYHASIAERCGVDMLVIGKQIDGAVCAGNEARWRNLVKDVRTVYTGPLAYAAWTNEGYSQAEVFPCDVLDYIVIYLYNRVAFDECPTVDELVGRFEYFNRTQFEPLSRRYGKRIIFLTPFQSRDRGAWQEWFESAAPAPGVRVDLMIQASMYEAFLRSIWDEEWVAGIWTWGYWWRDDPTTLFTRGDASFDKSSSVRGKPASEVLTRWWTRSKR